MTDDLNSMFRELKEIEAAISQSREMVEVIQKHLDHLPPEFLRDVQKVIAPLDVPRAMILDRVRHKDSSHLGTVIDRQTGANGQELLLVRWESGVIEKVPPDELEVWK